MKEFIKGALLTAGVLALVMGVRIAAFVPLHNETIAVENPAAIAKVNRSCTTQQTNTPCVQHTNEGS
jgi:hypothetical protein